MANKYIIEGATYNGDGTTSAEATSNGAAGAWNTLNYFEGTTPVYGTLAPGDVVRIRSKTAAGADITRTLPGATTIGKSSATSTSWITWILDNGETWPGVNGKLTYSCGGAYTLSLVDYNRYISMQQDALVIYEASASANAKVHPLVKNIVLKGALIDLSLATISGGAGTVSTPYAAAVFDSVHFKYNARTQELFATRDAARITLIAPDIELLTGLGLVAVILAEYANSVVEIVGGGIRGAGATSGQAVFRLGATSKITTVGFQFPRVMTLNSAQRAEVLPSICCVGLDSGAGALINENWGTADSRDDNFYPKLSAFLPNSVSTPWTWKIYPVAASMVKPVRLILSNIYTDTAAAKTVGVELLVATGMTACNADTLWVDVSYIDNTTGLSVCASSQDHTASALPTSTADWSAVTYGSVSFNKRRVSITTPTAIKQNTVVTATLRSTVIAPNTEGILFVSPDVTLS